jgi:hypothetical protein
VLGKLQASGRLLSLYRVLANSSAAFRPFVLLTGALTLDQELPADIREVVVLWLAARRNVDYEWDEHVRLSAAIGITDEQRAALRVSADLPAVLFTADQRLAVDVARAVLTGAVLPERLWHSAVTAWRLEGALNLILVVACWGAFVPTVIEAIGLRAAATRGTAQ